MFTLKEKMEEYKALIEKYKEVRNDFEGKMVGSCHGPKNNGYFALYHNMKHGQTSTKELIDFLRESCTVEENYSKLLMKLAKLAANTPPVGTFGPFWNILKCLIEKLSSLQMQLVHTWSDLIKDIIRYSEEQHKRHKTIKENEQPTLDSVQTIQQTTTAVHKAKEIYHTRCIELERLKRDNASQKDIEKVMRFSFFVKTDQFVSVPTSQHPFPFSIFHNMVTVFSETSGSPSPVLSDQPGPLSRSVKLRVSRTWFLKNKTKKKEKVKKKGKKEKDEKDSETNEPEIQDPNIEVDEEGYRIRPEHPMDNNGDKNSWYSSDSDSDSDGEESRRKLKVEIRPLSPTTGGGSTIEDIRASVEGLRLSPSAVRKRCQTPIDKKMKRSQSESDTLDKPGNHDLLNLDFLGSSSTASTPSTVNYNVSLPSPLSPYTEINWNSSTPTSSSVTSPLSGLPPPIARPPSRTRGLIGQPKLNGPIPMSRSDSNGSMTFTTTSMPIGSSRGPSPLTIGMSDTVPLAIAFTETVNAYFKGHDAQKCVVRIIGNVMMSFPAGVVKVFTENPSPALLSFRIKNADQWEQVIANSSLLIKDETLSTATVYCFEFNMSNLIEHLRQQGEQNKAASYFNIDILKYQVKSLPGVESTPLPLVVYWKCEDNVTDYRLDYRYNPKAMSSPVTLKNVVVAVPLDAEVTKMQSLPNGAWDATAKRANWKLNDISEVSEQESQGCIRAKFEMTAGPTKAVTTAVQFAAEGATLSGVDFELAGSGYRISLLKKRFATGKYFVDPEPSVSYA
uniref:MHD domain-containing protein n=1 Tax=Biomphalaria glabrata TaxID=6526 RepID=A0A2C9JSW5_BIOGL